MKALIDIGHPGHIHLFRPLATKLIENGWEILFTCRDKEAEIVLLKAFGFNYISFGKHYKGLAGKIFGLLKFDFKMIGVAKRFKPDVFLSHGSPYAAHGAFFCGKLNIALEDTGNKEQVMLYKPFTKYILTPSVFPDLYGKRQVKYNGYHELAYLSTKYFVPDANIFNLMDNPAKQKYAILRFVSWNATHDLMGKGLDNDISGKIIDLLVDKGFKVYITSEKPLPDNFEKYRIKISPHLFHHALFFSDIVIGDSQTIIAEAGVLGTPAIRFNNLVGSNHGHHHKELEEKHGLIYNIHTKDAPKLFETINYIITTKGIKDLWKIKKDKLFSEKIDVTEFLYNFIINKYKK